MDNLSQLGLGSLLKYGLPKLESTVNVTRDVSQFISEAFVLNFLDTVISLDSNGSSTPESMSRRELMAVMRHSMLTGTPKANSAISPQMTSWFLPSIAARRFPADVAVNFEEEKEDTSLRHQLSILWQET